MTPTNKYSEGFVIYYILLENEHSEFLLDSLEDKHFTIELYKTVFTIAKRLWKSKKYSQSALFDVLTKYKIGAKALADSLDAIYFITPANIEESLKATVFFLKDTYIKKTIQSGISDLTPAQISDLVNSSYESEGDIVDKSSLDKLIRQFIARDLEIIPYPFSLLNNLLGGIRKKEYTIIAARPSVGKTAFLEQIFWEATSLGKKCLFVSLEMGEEALFKRQILRTKGKDLFKTVITPEEKAVLYDSIKGSIGESSIAVGVFTPYDIDKLVKKTQPDIVLVDYLQQIMLRGNMSEFERVTLVTKELAYLKQKYNVAVVVASQYSRNAGQRKQPRLSDLRSSGQIEQDADVVLSLWKDEKEDTVLAGAIKVYIDCLKNRNGPVFCNLPEQESFKHQFSLMFLKDRVRFFDTNRPDEVKIEGNIHDLDDEKLIDLFNR